MRAPARFAALVLLSVKVCSRTDQHYAELRWRRTGLRSLFCAFMEITPHNRTLSIKGVRRGSPFATREAVPRAAKEK